MALRLSLRRLEYTDPKTVSGQSRDAARAIVVYAEDNDIDHIVVGTGGKGAATRLMLGSVSSDVIARATCPVRRRKIAVQQIPLAVANGQRRPRQLSRKT